MDTFSLWVVVFVIAISILIGAVLGKHFVTNEPDIQVTEWQAPNGLDRCYVARDGRGHFDLACVEVRR